MKTKSTFLVFLILLFTQLKLNAQEICMVTADFQEGENYMVLWEQFPDLTGLDSVLIYRQTSTAPFTFVGGEKIGEMEVTYFVDTTSDTKKFARYIMYLKDSTGTITGPSAWHQPISLDYESTGTFAFVPYQKENGSFYYYNAYVDVTGLGLFQYLNTTINYDDNTFVDTGYVSHPNANYYLESYVNNCDIQTKAEINTSRSNIKQQIATAALGVAIKEKKLTFSIAPNPAKNDLIIQLDEASYASIWVSNIMGKVLLNTQTQETNVKLNIENLSSGVYFVHVRKNDQVSSMKFIKRD